MDVSSTISRACTTRRCLPRTTAAASATNPADLLPAIDSKRRAQPLDVDAPAPVRGIWHAGYRTAGALLAAEPAPSGREPEHSAGIVTTTGDAGRRAEPTEPACGARRLQGSGTTSSVWMRRMDEELTLDRLSVGDTM